MWQLRHAPEVLARRREGPLRLPTHSAPGPRPSLAHLGVLKWALLEKKEEGSSWPALSNVGLSTA